MNSQKVINGNKKANKPQVYCARNYMKSHSYLPIKTDEYERWMDEYV